MTSRLPSSTHGGRFSSVSGDRRFRGWLRAYEVTDCVAVTGKGRVKLAVLGNAGRPSRSPLCPPPAPAMDSAAAADLTDVLCEFDAVLADFASPFHERHFHYEEHLERMKRRSSASVSDSSGFSDSESK